MPIYKAEARITKVLLKAAPEHLTEERICRDFAKMIVKDMPIEDLKQLFNFKVIDPENKETKKEPMNPETPEWRTSQILQLWHDKVVLYEANILIP